MALTGKTVADTYKDLLTVNSVGFDGQGLESTRKRVIDGEGVNSALFLGTNDLAFSGPIIGDVNIQGALQVDGSTTLDSLVIRNNQDENNTILEHYRSASGATDQTRLKGVGRIYMKEHIDNSDTLTMSFVSGDLIINTDMNIRSTLTITDPSTGNSLVLDPNSKDLGGSGDKAKVSFTDTEVKLAKGDTALFTAKEDGTARIKEVSSFPTSGTANGDLVNVSGVLYVNA